VTCSLLISIRYIAFSVDHINTSSISREELASALSMQAEYPAPTVSSDGKESLSAADNDSEKV
jgi:hypothetical protein